MALLRIVSWMLFLDNRQATAVVYVDLKKAFDTVNHDILLKRLGKIGINQNMQKWF